MLVVNEDWERQMVPKAIGELMKDLMASSTFLVCSRQPHNDFEPEFGTITKYGSKREVTG
jgi:hypothetical protein